MSPRKPQPKYGWSPKSRTRTIKLTLGGPTISVGGPVTIVPSAIPIPQGSTVSNPWVVGAWVQRTAGLSIGWIGQIHSSGRDSNGNPTHQIDFLAPGAGVSGKDYPQSELAIVPNASGTLIGGKYQFCIGDEVHHPHALVNDGKIVDLKYMSGLGDPKLFLVEFKSTPQANPWEFAAASLAAGAQP
jgi:hypothetical protein